MSHFPATRFLLQPRLTPTSHPSHLFLPSEPCTCLFWVLLPPRALRTVFPASSGYFFLNPNPCTCLGKCSSTFPVVPRLFFFSIRSVSLVFSLPNFQQPYSAVFLISMTKYGMASSQVSSVTAPESLRVRNGIITSV